MSPDDIPDATPDDNRGLALRDRMDGRPMSGTAVSMIEHSSQSVGGRTRDELSDDDHERPIGGEGPSRVGASRVAARDALPGPENPRHGVKPGPRASGESSLPPHWVFRDYEVRVVFDGPGWARVGPTSHTIWDPGGLLPQSCPSVA